MAQSAKRLDRKATILAPTKGRDTDGGPDVTYTASGAPRWCRREDTGGDESRRADALRYEASAIFTFNWFSGVTAENRISHEGKVYDIVAPPIEIGRRFRLEILVRERPAQTD